MKFFFLAYLLNALWQLPLVFAAAWAAACVLRRAGPALEHRVWCGALIVQAILPACHVDLSAISRLAHRLPGSHGEAITVTTGEGQAFSVAHLPSVLPRLLLIAYATAGLYATSRLFWGLYKTAVLRRHAALSKPDGVVAASWYRCAHRFSVSSAQLAISMEIAGPITIGVLKRILLLPATWINILPAEDLEAAIAHEFAHIRRRDYAKNLLYQVLSLPIDWHPVVWLTRSRIAESREILCDELAAQAVAGKQQYAYSLLRLASEFTAHNRRPATHAIGIFDANNFERRIMKLTQPSPDLQGVKRFIAIAACFTLALGATASALALRINIRSPVPSSAIHSASVPAEFRQASGAPARVSGGVMAGNILTKVPPVYPPEAKAAGIQGAVVLHVVIGKQGEIKSLRLVSGQHDLAIAAFDAVKQWTYRPYLLNGNPVEVDTTITVNFQIKTDD